MCYRQAEAFSVDERACFYRQVRAAYPDVETIYRVHYRVQDNGPVHFHADLIGQLEAQRWPWPLNVPLNVPEHWPDVPEEPVASDPLPIQLLCLPTYAPWLNPIEKLWRWLKQEVIHLHRLADAFDELNFDELKRRVASFFGAPRRRIASAASVYRAVTCLIYQRPSKPVGSPTVRSPTVGSSVNDAQYRCC